MRYCLRGWGRITRMWSRTSCSTGQYLIIPGCINTSLAHSWEDADITRMFGIQHLKAISSNVSAIVSPARYTLKGQSVPAASTQCEYLSRKISGVASHGTHAPLDFQQFDF